MYYQEPYSTNELERYISKEYDKIAIAAKLDGVYEPLSTNFTECTSHSHDGNYCFSDNDGYHFCSIERGITNSNRVTKSLFEISYWVIESQIFWIAVEYERKHRIQNQDSRRMIFSKELQYLNEVGTDYRNKAESEINETLCQNPFQDELFR
jgi:hypothetical protein